MKICSNCQKENKDDAGICVSCSESVFEEALSSQHNEEVSEDVRNTTENNIDMDCSKIDGLLLLVALGRIFEPISLIFSTYLF